VKLSRVNGILLVMIVLVNGYVITAPLLPALLFTLHAHQGVKQHLERELAPVASSTGKSRPEAGALDGPNHIVIPSMLLDQPVLEGPVSQTYKILDDGIWRWPHGSTPDKGSNTVLIGHRFTYTNPRGVFYYLNKVKINDQIGIFWQHKEYLYKVVSIRQVTPADTAIEAATTTAQLTLFTCTPLWLPKDRLVVVADLEQVTL
jgi:LPXTG-site transpeptidase (sortase) family protein